MISQLVLIADDNRDAADSLCDLVSLFGCEVLKAYDGQSALTLAAERIPDVAILDIKMPGMDGYQLARALRTSSGPGVVLVALTGHHDSAEKAYAAGFDVYLHKPISMDELESLLNDPLGRASDEAARRDKPSAPRPS